LFEGRHSRKFHNLADVADKKLAQLHAAERLSDLALFPGNRLETLKGARAGQYSVRMNDQFRLVFTWRDGEAFDVEIVDYH
jgi:toxin HigB-1